MGHTFAFAGPDVGPPRGRGPPKCRRLRASVQLWARAFVHRCGSCYARAPLRLSPRDGGPSCSLSLSPSDATFPWSPGTLCLPGPRAPRAVPNRFLHSFCPGLPRLVDRRRARRCSGLGGGAALGLVSLPRFLRAIRGVWSRLEICFDGIRCWGWRRLGETRQGRWLWLWRIAVRAIG
jgi:hypothetical protein